MTIMVGDMEFSDIHLFKSSSEIVEHAQAARHKFPGGILLVPVDFSAHSAAALVKASKFAQLMSASLVVLHVVNDPAEMPGYYSGLIKKKQTALIPQLAAEAFAAFMTSIIEVHPSMDELTTASLMMVKGLPVTRILEVVETLEPRMVIIGSQGRTGLENIVIGSKASQIVRLCPVPVTVVKHTEQNSPE